MGRYRSKPEFLEKPPKKKGVLALRILLRDPISRGFCLWPFLGLSGRFFRFLGRFVFVKNRPPPRFCFHSIFEFSMETRFERVVICRGEMHSTPRYGLQKSRNNLRRRRRRDFTTPTVTRKACHQTPPNPVPASSDIYFIFEEKIYASFFRPIGNFCKTDSPSACIIICQEMSSWVDIGQNPNFWRNPRRKKAFWRCAFYFEIRLAEVSVCGHF